ncbi:MAG: hypothetical protein R2879_20920, partial [Saprospiraceae bacterium]
KNWDEQIFVRFRCNLFHLLLEFKVFKTFENFIKEVDEKYNGLLIKGSDLKRIINNAENLLDGNDKYLGYLSELLREVSDSLQNGNLEG